MFKEILKEELGISNTVSLLTLKIKQEISTTYSKNKNNKENYFTLDLTKHDKVTVFGDILNITLQNINIEVFFVVMGNYNDYILSLYTKKYKPVYNIETNQIKLFLYTNKNNNKIKWSELSQTLQHEVEHFYQAYCKGDKIKSDETFEKYEKYQNFIKDKNQYKKLIGFVYYYFDKLEQNAIANELYRKIMDMNKISFIETPEEILKNFSHYKNLNNIKKLIIQIEDNNNGEKDKLMNELNLINKTYSSFLTIAKRTIDEYTKKFGRTLYKAKLDLNKNTFI